MRARYLLALIAVIAISASVRAQTAPPPPPPVVVDKPAATPPVTPTATPELVKLEAEAAVEIPAPQVPAGRAPEAKRVAETAVKVRRASWVVEKLLPPPPDGLTSLSFASLKVGTRGWLDTTGDVTKTVEGVMLVRPSGATTEGLTVGLPATDAASSVKTVSLRGEYLVDRAVTVDGREVLVLKEVAAAKALDPAATRLINAARIRLEEAKADYANATAVLTAAKKKAVDAVMEQATVQAAKQIPVPDNAEGEQRIKAKRDQDDLAGKLAKAELDKIAEAYGVVTAADPTRK
jgi:hypothetical protein